MKLPRSLLLFALLPHVVIAETNSPESHIDSIFSELRTLKSMQSGRRYTLPAGGSEMSGGGDDFLRRRTASEIRESGLSCGCGDYAVVFIEQIKARGFEALLVDSAQISSVSLANTFAGHAVVAIRRNDAPDATWWLVDSTARKLISRDWSPKAKSFSASGHVYWIGYCGPLENYPVRTPDELKQFYRDTLATVPPEFFNRTLYRFAFTVDRSLVDNKGDYLNPRIDRLRQEQDRIFAKYGIRPAREIPILLIRGGNDASSNMDYIDDRWVSRVGLQSACSPSFLSYLEQTVRRHELTASR